MFKRLIFFASFCFAFGFTQSHKPDTQKTGSQKSMFVGLWESAERHVAILYANGKLEITKAGIMLCTANWVTEGKDKIKISNIKLRVKSKEPVPNELFLDVLSPKKVKLDIDNKSMIFLKIK